MKMGAGNGLPLLLIDTNDRNYRPKEYGFGKWKERVSTLVKTLQKHFASQGIEMSDQDAFEYVAWAMETSLSRILWTLGDDPEAMKIVSSATYDAMERYTGHRLGMWPAPRGQRFEDVEDFETQLAGHIRAEQPTQTDGETRYTGMYL